MNNKKTSDLRIKIVEKLKLSPEQREHLAWRLSLPEHKFDCGPGSLWNSDGYQPNLYAAVLLSTGEPIGVLYRSGLPNEIHASLWVDSKFRGKGYGSEMTDLLAALLVAEGATAIGELVVNTFRGEYDIASTQLAARLKSQFAMRH